MRRPLLRGSVIVAAMALLLVGPAAGADQGDTIRISERPNGFGVNGDSRDPAISADGRYVAFTSNATNLVTDDTNGTNDVFVHDTLTGATTRVSVDSNGEEGNGQSFGAAISADGRLVAFQSRATNLVSVDTNGFTDIFLHDILTGTTSRVSVDSNGVQADHRSQVAAISGDGRYVAFESLAANLVANDNNGLRDVFVHDTGTGVTSRVSVDSNGLQAADGPSLGPSVSADGRYIAFQSYAPNLVPDDDNGRQDVFVRDMDTGVTTLASVDSNGILSNGGSGEPAISADGRHVAFYSSATNLVPDDINGANDVFVHDTVTGVTSRVSVDSDGMNADDGTWTSTISADGRYIAFESEATNLVPDDNNGFTDVFIHDLATGATVRVSVDGSGVQADGESFFPAISADGRFVAYQSSAQNLVGDDTNGFDDVFRHEFFSDPPTPPGDGDPFSDDDRSIFESDIEALARAGITKGCNPPENTRFCPSDPVTRGQMAAFLVRALGYSDDGGGDLFSDDDGSTFEADIDRLGTAGVTKGCNPPDNTRFCPSDPVTRGQMAAFLVRALGYSDDGGGDLFSDDDGSTFEVDIDRLGTAGVTKGCNPPDNTRFCPTDPVTRGQMAAFLTRALDLK